MVIYIAIAVIMVVAAILIYKRKKREKEMPAGLRIFDANKNPIFDADTDLMRIVESRVLRGSGTINVESLGYYGTKIFVIVLSHPYYSPSYTDPPEISMTISGTALTWENMPQEGEGVPANVLIGVY